VPNTAVRRTARTPKPRHQKARTTENRYTENPRTDQRQGDNPRYGRGDSATDGSRDRRGDARGDRRDDRSGGGQYRTDGPRRSDTRGRDGAPAGAGGRDDQRGRKPFAADRKPTQRRDSWSDDRRPRREDARPDRRTADRGSFTDRSAFTDRPAAERGSRGRTDSPRAERRSTVAGSQDQAGTWDGEIAEDAKRVKVSFAELGLPTPLLRALEESGITEPFPIQSATLPDALGGRDVLGRAQTGSGKTLAFGLALLTRLHKGQAKPLRPRGLILVPTRELAMQVADALTPLARSLGLWCRTVVGGLSFSKQAEQLRRGVDLLIATPGRLSDHVRQGTCVLDDVRFTALDEADQMADMGFLPQVRAILDLVPEGGQRMLFSATLDRDVAQLVNRYLTDPVTHSVSPATATVSTMDHHLLLVSSEDKAAVVAEMAAREGRTIMFLRTKHHVDRLTKQLRAVGVHAGALHGGKPQGARNRVLGEFKDGRLPVLIATDVAARGIHVDGVSLVVHVDPPADAKGYLHRAGRTARAGESGTVVTVVTHQERRTVFRMTEQAGVEPERTKVRPGDADLVRITGARTPSGDPVVDPEPANRPTRPRSGGGRFNSRPGGRSRRHDR
jgi:superfamily II DNA/RNA helicase